MRVMGQEIFNAATKGGFDLQDLGKAVSLCLYINLDRSGERRQQFEEWSGPLPFHRVPGVDGKELPDAVIAAVTNSDLLGNSPAQHRGAIGCAMSHLRAIETAMSMIMPGDERPVLIMEDDGHIPQENLSLLKAMLESGEIGDHFLLRSAHPSPRGYFPIETSHPNIVEPSNAIVATGYLVTPKMLPILRDVFMFNLERSDMRQIDLVIATLHRNLALRLTPPAGTYDEDLLRVYWDSCERNGVDAPKFRAANPSLVLLAPHPSTIRADDTPANPTTTAGNPDAIQTGPDLSVAENHPLKALTREQAVALKDLVAKIMPALGPDREAHLRTLLHEFILDLHPESPKTFAELIGKIQAMSEPPAALALPPALKSDNAPV